MAEKLGPLSSNIKELLQSPSLFGDFSTLVLKGDPQHSFSGNLFVLTLMKTYFMMLPDVLREHVGDFV